jgi:dual-specificity kinase
MSTPSTATAVHPQTHHFYPTYQEYQSQPTSYRANPPPNTGLNRLAFSNNYNASVTTPDVQRPSTSHSQRSNHHATQPVSSPVNQAEMPPPSSATKRKADWNEFYKNGLPQEVIYIDDDSPQPPPAARRKENEPQEYEHSHRRQAADSSRQADKRRRVDESATYDPVYKQNGQAAQTHYSHESLSASVDTRGRTNSGAYSTAPTSMNSSVQSLRQPANQDDRGGGKRKRKDYHENSDEIHEIFDYFPPPRPPIKANDVTVRSIRDVSNIQQAAAQPSIDFDRCTRLAASSTTTMTATTLSKTTQASLITVRVDTAPLHDETL